MWKSENQSGEPLGAIDHSIAYEGIPPVAPVQLLKPDHFESGNFSAFSCLRGVFFHVADLFDTRPSSNGGSRCMATGLIPRYNFL